MAIASAAASQLKGLLPKPRLSIAQIFTMSVGFLGIQFGFALQNGNTSRILRSFGADVDQLSHVLDRCSTCRYDCSTDYWSLQR